MSNVAAAENADNVIQLDGREEIVAELEKWLAEAKKGTFTGLAMAGLYADHDRGFQTAISHQRGVNQRAALAMLGAVDLLHRDVREWVEVEES